MKIKGFYLVGGVVSLGIMLMAIAGIFVAGKFTQISTFLPKPLTHIPSELPIAPSWLPEKGTFIFYFTIQSNILSIIFMFLVGLGVVNIQKNKKAVIFEGISLINVVVSGLVFGSVIAGNEDLLSNYYSLIENIGLHIVVPVGMLALFIVKKIKTNEREVKLEYKEFYKFLIYPIVWLVIAIIVYYSTRESVNYIITKHFATSQLANDGSAILTKASIVNKVTGKSIKFIIPGVGGNAIYGFLNFDNANPFAIAGVYFGSVIGFSLLALLYIRTYSKKPLFQLLKKTKN